MTLLLVRHAKAGSRHDWDGADIDRPLSGKGREQAEALVDVLATYGPALILASTSVRCIQTVEPLAIKLGLTVEPSEDLAEGQPLRRALDLVRSVTAVTAVLCGHGDTIPGLLYALADLDGLRLPPRADCAKGSVWVLDGEDGRYTEGMYLPPPL